jgi:hypothetical protein
MNHVTEQTVLAAMLVGFLVLGGASSQGGTNDFSQDPSAGSNASQTNEWVCVAQQLSWQGDKDTNGWSSLLYISNDPWHSDERPPMCGVSIKNITTNRLSCWIGFYGETYSRIELLDSTSRPVEKTAEGKQIGTRTNTAQIREMVKARFQQANRGRARTDGFIRLPPGRTCGIAFSIPDLFVIRQPGEYTLTAQVCLIQRVGGEKYDPELRITWSPPVTAKFQLRPKAASLRESPIGRTNGPSR